MTPFPERGRTGLYAIADSHWLAPSAMPNAVAAAIRGGACVVQLRDKIGTITPDTGLLRELLGICRDAGVPFLINDEPGLAVELDADGIHISWRDADMAALRRQLGGMIIGVSCHDELQAALDAQAAGADYVAFGRFFPSNTKPDAVTAELDLLREARARLRCPIVAIGGITPDNSARILAAGADLVAVVEGLFGQPDPEITARDYLAGIHHAQSSRE